MADTGNSSTIAFGSSSFSANVYLIGATEQTREPLEDTHLGVTGEKTYIADDLIEPGQFELEFEWDQSFGTFPPISAAAETITITYPLKSGEGTAATLAGTGFLISSSGPSVENGTIMRGSATVKWDGKTGPTYTAGSV